MKIKQINESTTVLRMDSFYSVSENEIKRVITNLSNATCLLDPIHTSLVKQSQDILLPIHTQIVNLFLNSGVFSTAAIMKPALKKPHLDRNILKNCRLASNIPF